MERWIVDRFEEGFAVCEREDGTTVSVGRDLLPAQAREGDCLMVEGEDSISIDQEATRARRARLARRTRSLFED